MNYSLPAKSFLPLPLVFFEVSDDLHFRFERRFLVHQIHDETLDGEGLAFVVEELTEKNNKFKLFST